MTNISDYLNEKESFMKISADWKECIAGFQDSSKQSELSGKNDTNGKEFCW